MLTSCGRFPIQFHLNAGQPHAPLYGVPWAPSAGPPTLLRLHRRRCHSSLFPLSSLKLQFSHWGGCMWSKNVCAKGGGMLFGLDWQPTGYSCHYIHCILSLYAQRAMERIRVKWDDINYPNPDGPLWSSASTRLSQERTWMVRQRECQRNEMKDDKSSREYSPT